MLGSAHLHSPGLYLRMRSQMALRAYGSTPAVGSSKITARDPPTKAIATDSFLFMPPERVCTREWRLLESSRSSIILGTGEKHQGCHRGRTGAQCLREARDTSSPHGTCGFWPPAQPSCSQATEASSAGFHSLIPQGLENTWWSCSGEHLCSQITHHSTASRKGTHSHKRRRWGKRSWEGAYLSISLRISSSAMLLSCE